jgi:hypothetical protein
LFERALKYAALLAVSLCVMGWVAGMYIATRMHTAPLTPDPVSGRIFSHNNHGVIHYLSSVDHLVDKVSEIGLVIGVPTIFIVLLLRPIPLRSK